MTLRDILDSGIVLDGNVVVSDYDSDTDRYDVLDAHTDEALDAEVRFIYAHGFGELCIEVSRSL